MEWQKVGSDIDGTVALAKFGSSVALSGDGTIMAVGAPNEMTSWGEVNDISYVKVYKKVSDDWTLMGTIPALGYTSIREDNLGNHVAHDLTGLSVALSYDGSTLAIGEPRATSDWEGYARVFEYNTATSTWAQKGSIINTHGNLVGASISLSRTGSIVAVGVPYGVEGNKVAVYEYKQIDTSYDWTQLGLDIEGSGNSGWSVSLSSNGFTVAIGAPYISSDTGRVRIYEFLSGVWSPMGDDINGELSDDHSGWSVSLSADGKMVAIGAPDNDGAGNNAGHVRVYEYKQTGDIYAWSQLGLDIEGVGKSGLSVCLRYDSTMTAPIVAIGSPDGGATATTGLVRVFKWTGSNWLKLGLDIGDGVAGDAYGSAVSLSADGTVLAIGNPVSEPNSLVNAGRVRVYELAAISTTTTTAAPTTTTTAAPTTTTTAAPTTTTTTAAPTTTTTTAAPTTTTTAAPTHKTELSLEQSGTSVDPVTGKTQIIWQLKATTTPL